jgi:hypothetical protein
MDGTKLCKEKWGFQKADFIIGKTVEFCIKTAQ